MNMNAFGMPMGMQNMNMMNMGMTPNMNMGMQNMNMMNMGMNPAMNMMGMGVSGGMPNMQMEDDSWLEGFKMGVEEVKNPGNNDDDSNTPGPKMNVIFTTTVGTQRIIKINYGTSVSNALRKYLNSVNKPELFGQNDKVNFLYNAQKLAFDDNTPIETKFANMVNPKIVVNDTQGLIGA